MSAGWIDTVFVQIDRPLTHRVSADSAALATIFADAIRWSGERALHTDGGVPRTAELAIIANPVLPRDICQQSAPFREFFTRVTIFISVRETDAAFADGTHHRPALGELPVAALRSIGWQGLTTNDTLVGQMGILEPGLHSRSAWSDHTRLASSPSPTRRDFWHTGQTIADTSGFLNGH